MTLRNYIGIALAVALFGIFGLYIHGGGSLTAVAGFIFGGGLLFCGVLIDFDHFAQIFRIYKGEK